MALSIYGQSTSNEYPGGIFITKATIISAEDISGEQLVYMNKPCDVGVRLTLEVGREWQPTLNIAGNLKREGNESSWGNAWIVRAFFQKMAMAGDIEEAGGKCTIPVEMVQGLVGKQFYKLSYCAGMKEKDPTKVRYAEWYEVATIDEGPDALHARFLKNLTKGYPKNYNPEAWDSRKADAAPATGSVPQAASSW